MALPLNYCISFVCSGNCNLTALSVVTNSLEYDSDVTDTLTLHGLLLDAVCTLVACAISQSLTFM